MFSKNVRKLIGVLVSRQPFTYSEAMSLLSSIGSARFGILPLPCVFKFFCFNDEPNNEVAQTIHVVDPNSRFKSYTDIDKFIFENENENTRKKTLGHIKLLSKFLAEQGEQREIYTIPSTELNNILCKFLVGARQKNGQEYEPFYLRGMLSSYERHLKRQIWVQHY
jgi:hypothetical protein